MKYSTLRKGLFEALKIPLESSGGVSPAAEKEIKKIANMQADSIIEFLKEQTFTVTEFKGAVKLNTLSNNPIDGDLKIAYTFSMIGIYFLLIKMLFEPLNKIPITKPAYAAIIGIISQLEKALGALVPSNPGAGQVGLPVELDENATGLVAHGHCFVGPEAAGIGEDGQVIANPEGEHTKIKLVKIKQKEMKKI